MTHIIIESLYKIYQGTVETVALENFNEKFDKGEAVAIAGPSGSGKTSLLSCIGGVLKPTSGRILIDGNDITKLSDDELVVYRRDQVGLIYQDFNLIDEFSIYENVALPMLIANKDKSAIDERVSELLETLDIQRYVKTFPNYLSGGEKQRVAIAVALANDPDIILADEPTGNLDLVSRENVIDVLISKCKDMNKALLIATHDPFIMEKVDRVIDLPKLIR
ncbi:MAG TPA: ABC transporter ATP-binding protein [Candidatus Bathyarchaeia archaeon]|nr:ABC transporter ATP-binding protein [Candidatus Bathyarchaeia archaeon]